MESLQPDDQQWTNPLESIKPNSYVLQAFELLEMQKRHQQILDAKGISSLAYGALGHHSQALIDNTPLQLRRYFTYRRMHPKHSATTSNIEFGVMFLHGNQQQLENGLRAFPIHVPVGEIVDHEVVASDKNEDVFSKKERQIVYDLMQEVLASKDDGTLPDIKYDLSGIVDQTGSTDKPTPLV